MAHEGQATCGAKTRSGKQCAAVAMANGRCYFHGGKSTGPKVPANGNQNAKSHGIYSRHLTDEEREREWPVGTLENEIVMARTSLDRLYARKRVWEASELTGDDDEVSWDLAELEIQEGERPFGKDADTMPFHGKKIVKKRPDFEGMEIRLLGRIESLEKTHRELTGGNVGTPLEKARQINEAVNEIDSTIPVPPKPTDD